MVELWLELSFPLANGLLLTMLTWLMAGPGRASSLESLLKGTSPIMRGPTLMASSKSNHLPKASLPNTLPLGIMAPRNPFWGDIALSIAPLKWLMITQVGKKNQETVTSGISQVCMTFLLQTQAGAAELPLIAEAATTSQKSLQEKSCPEQSWKRQAMPSVREDKSQSAGECRGRSG